MIDVLDPLFQGLVAGFLALWFLASAVFQFQGGKLLARLERRDRYHLLPRWTFFAPMPFNRDFELLYRDRDPNGVLAKWRLIAMPELSFWNIVWNPTKRTQKALIDLCDRVSRTVPQSDGPEITATGSYRALEAFVCGVADAEPGWERQFMIVLSDGYRLPNTRQILLISSFRPLS